MLNEYGIADTTFEINRRAAEIAREVASSHAADGRPRFVIGSIGPGHPAAVARPDSLRRAARRLRARRSTACSRAASTSCSIETVYDLLQAKAAINGARAAMRRAGLSNPLPIMVQVTVETTGRMLVGTEIGAALTALEAMQPDVIGMNCATGPAEMTEHLRYLAQHARTFLSALPNAGLPSVVDGHTHYDLTPDALADAHERFVSEFGLNIVGGCCGTTPEHLRAVDRAARRRPRAGRADARVRARLLVDLLARAVPSGARVPGGRRAHERQRLAEVPRGDARSRLGHVRRRWRASR